MPWVAGSSDKIEVPAHYQLPRIMSDDTCLGRNISQAYWARKEFGQVRECLLAAQKQCGKDRRDDAKFISQMAADILKDYRGTDLAIIWIETSRSDRVSEEIAPYVDRAFAMMDLGGGDGEVL